MGFYVKWHHDTKNLCDLKLFPKFVFNYNAAAMHATSFLPESMNNFNAIPEDGKMQKLQL